MLLNVSSCMDVMLKMCSEFHMSLVFFHFSAIWRRIYMTEFGSQMWRPKSADDAASKVEPAGEEDRSAGHWKKLYFRTVAGQEMSKWRKELKDISPYTGLPRQTEWVLRYGS